MKPITGLIDYRKSSTQTMTRMVLRQSFTLLYRHAIFAVILVITALPAAQPTITVQADKPGMAISPLLWGIFYEDINWGADGGLYAELVQNRSFEYSNVFGSNFTPTTSWSLLQRGGASATMTVSTQNPLNAINTHYLTLTVSAAGSGAGLSNTGFAGIPVKIGDTYNFSFFARKNTSTAAFTISLESASGTVYGTASIPGVTGDWKRYTAVVTANATDNNARLVLLTTTTGSVDLDMISLFPRNTFKNRENGLRADLVQRLVDMNPAFIRFPGGCIVHSNNLATAYRWKTTIGPLEERKNNANRWGYMQTGGLGFYEYFQLCEDIGAKPVPILPVGVSCHFKTPYEVTPLDSMMPWIRDALDLIEYANGPETSTWGAKRAAAGHPEPFNLEYIGVGNEEWGQEFKDRSNLFISAIRQKYPEIKIVGTSGPYASGTDYDDLWAYNRSQNTDIVDEHYYQDTAWFIRNTHRYDGFSRTGPWVFAGEYASRNPMQKRLGNAISEAAFITGLERNSDVVLLSSYAPLLHNVNCNGSPAEGPWDPCLIYFDNNRSYCTPSYFVQVMFANNTGQFVLPTVIQNSGTNGPLFCAASKDTVTGDIIVKVANTSTSVLSTNLRIEGEPSLLSTGSLTVLTSTSAGDENSFSQPTKVAPVTSTLTSVTASLQRQFPAYSLSVLRLKTKTVSSTQPRQQLPASVSAKCPPGIQWVSRGSRKSINVGWTQEKPGFVSIKIFASSGVLMGEIIRDTYFYSGNHQISWTCPSGEAHGLIILYGSIAGRRFTAAGVRAIP